MMNADEIPIQKIIFDDPISMYFIPYLVIFDLPYLLG